MKKLIIGISTILVLAFSFILVFLLLPTRILQNNSLSISEELSRISPLATPTPALWETVIPVATATPRTPLTIARTIDLTNGTPVPQEEIAIVIVDRQDGTHDKYLVPPWLWSREAIKLLEQKMEMQSGDHYSYLSPIEHRPLLERILDDMPVEAQSIIPTEESEGLAAIPTSKSESLTRIVDLSNGKPFPSDEIIPLFVYRANGSLEKYLVPLALLPDLSRQTLNDLIDAESCDSVLRPVMVQPKELPEGVRRIPTPMPERGIPPPIECSPIPVPYDMATFNLARELPDEEIVVTIVLRVTGVYEKYLLPLEPIRANNTMEGLDNFLHFAPGDVFIDSYPLAPRRQSAYPPPTFYIPPTPVPYTGEVVASTPAPPTATP